tara:strand:+ start:452 stop:700 length:249 start_codon:yes stop_codon:yes gene_type:complete
MTMTHKSRYIQRKKLEKAAGEAGLDSKIEIFFSEDSRWVAGIFLYCAEGGHVVKSFYSKGFMTRKDAMRYLPALVGDAMDFI